MQRPLRFLFALVVAGVLCGSAPMLAQAQQQQISGTVLDATDSTSIPGANIVVPGTTVGTATGPDGTYQLAVPADADSLRFSFVGYDARTVAIAGRSVIDVALGTSAAQLEDLVVIGYGAVEERDVTGSIARVDPDEFNPSAAVAPEQLISGKVAGVQISSSSGAPGSQSYIRIRGATSVNADSQPLFVIDGVPVSNEAAQAQRNPLNFINKNDIANITVLKDASATAIYGSRGANGVILIETKNASEGESQITYNGSVSASDVTSRIDVLNADEFREVVAEQEPSQLSLLGDANTDWQDQADRTAIGQDHSLSFSRGFEDSDFRLSLGYLDQEGILQASSTERVNVSLTYNQRLLDDRLSIRSNVRGARTEDEFEPGSLVGGAASFAPTQPIRDVSSEFGGFFEWTGENRQLAENNPLAEYILAENTGKAYRGFGNVEVEYELPFVEGLSARTNVGYDVSTGERVRFAPTNLKEQNERDAPAGTIERFNFERSNVLVDAFLDYRNTFETIDSEFYVTGGYSYQDFNEEYPEFTARGLNTNIFGPNSTAPVIDPEFTTTSVTEIPSRLISTFGRINYTFQDKYLLTATIRRDGSSRFGPENRWGTFPSAALAWRIEEEPFMEAVPTISSLKLRVSAGVTGNQEIGDFQYAPLYAPGGPAAQVQFGAGEDAEFISTVRPAAADEELKWEETTSYDMGLDYGILEGRVSGALDFYLKDTNDLLFVTTAPGFSNLSDRVLTNIGSMRNRGFEFSVDGAVVDRDDFSYNAQFNAAYNQNELLKINRQSGDPGFIGILTGGISGALGNQVQILREGEAVNSFFVYRHKRDANGDPIYEDTNGDGSITDIDLYEDVAGTTDTLASGEIVEVGDGFINTQDRVIAGSPQPDWILGHTSQVRYQGFDLGVTVRAHLGGQVYNNVASNFGHFSRFGTGSFAPSNVHASVLETGFDTPQFLSDVYVEDASFLRVDNITLGYTLRSIPRVAQLRVYASASNVFVLTGYSGTDPEVGGPGSSDIGIDNNVYPRSRTFTTGISVRL